MRAGHEGQLNSVSEGRDHLMMTELDLDMRESPYIVNRRQSWRTKTNKMKDFVVRRYCSFLTIAPGFSEK